MDFDIGIASGVEGWEAAQRAEAPGRVALLSPGVTR
jgi:hypothetical protein